MAACWPIQFTFVHRWFGPKGHMLLFFDSSYVMMATIFLSKLVQLIIINDKIMTNWKVFRGWKWSHWKQRWKLFLVSGKFVACIGKINTFSMKLKKGDQSLLRGISIPRNIFITIWRGALIAWHQLYVTFSSFSSCRKLFFELRKKSLPKLIIWYSCDSLLVLIFNFWKSFDAHLLHKALAHTCMI